MRNLSLVIEKAGHTGEFYFMATLYMVIYSEIGQLLIRYHLKKDFKLKLYPAKFKQVTFKLLLRKCYNGLRMIDRNMKY